MKKKRLIALILLLLVLLAISLYHFVLVPIIVREYRLENGYIEKSVNLNNDGYLDTVSLEVKEEKGLDSLDDVEYAAHFIGKILNGTGYTDYILTINDKSFVYEINKNYRVSSLGFADLNKDGKTEIMVGYYDMSISPSYNRWIIYDINGDFKINILDGGMIYNRLSDKLKVEYSVRESPTGTFDKQYFDMGYLK